MNEIAAGAAYRRKPNPAPEAAMAVIRVHPDVAQVAEHVWSLLETSQTAGSLQKALSARGVQTAPVAQIAAMLNDLMRRDFIEVSPDT